VKDYIRNKRKNGRVHTWPTKLYIPVPLATKNQFVACARANNLSQAELGAVIVMHYLMNLHLATAAIAEYERTAEEERSEYLESRSEEGRLREFDRTFGGVFKSSFSDDDNE